MTRCFARPLLRLHLLAAFLGCVWWSGSVSTSFAQTKIPRSDKAFTQAKFNKAYYEYLKQDVQAYQQHTRDQGEVRALGTKFLEEVIKAETRQPEWLQNEELVTLGRKVIESRSEDPFLLGCVGHVFGRSNGDRRALIQPIAGRLAASGYGPRQQMLVRRWIVEGLGPGLEPEVAAACNEAVVIWLKSERQQTAQRRFIWEALGPFIWLYPRSQRKIFVDACLKVPNLDPWLKEILVGADAFETARALRGGGWAHQVTPEGAKGHEENQVIAATHFRAAWKIDPQLPHAATLMIEIAKAGNDTETPRMWFDRAVKAQMDFDAAYFAMRTSLQPRWGGNHKALYAFGLECAQTKRYDTAVPLQLIDCLTLIEDDLGTAKQIWRRPGIFPKVREMMHGYEAVDSPRETMGRMSALAAVAIRAGDYVEARRALDKLRKDGFTDIVPNPFGLLHVDLPSGIWRTFASTAEAAPTMAKLNPLLDKLDEANAIEIDQALELLLQARDQNKMKAAVPFFIEWESVLKIKRQMVDGKWVDLTFDETPLQWFKTDSCVVDYRHEFATMRRTTPPGQQPKNVRIELAARLNVPFEVEVDVEAEGGAKAMTWGGVAIGRVFRTESGRFFFVSPNGGWTGVSITGRPSDSIKAIQPSKVRLRVAAWQGVYQVSVCDNWFRREDVANFEPAGLISLGIPGGMTSEVPIRFSRLRIRKLKADPPPALSDKEANIEYFSKILADEPDNLTALYWRGLAYRGLGKLEDAAKDLRQVVDKGQKPTDVKKMLESIMKKDGK